MKKITFISKYLIIIATMLFTQYAISQNSWNTAAIYDGSCYYEETQAGVNNTSGEMTVEFWIKLNTPNDSYSIIGKNQFRIMTDLNNIRVQVDGLSALYSTAKIEANQWTHVAVSFSNANNAIKIYLNGNLDNSLTTFNGNFAATADALFVGKSLYAGNLKGELDEVRIWNTVRTDSEIQNNYRSHLSWNGLSFYDSHLVFCQTYDFDVYSPGTYFPYGGNNGTFGSDILGNKPSQTVIHNNSMYFTGSSYLESSLANDPDISLSGPMTAEAWIYPTSIGTKQTILDLKQIGNGGYKLDLETTGNISWTMNQSGAGDIILTPNKWYHIAVICQTPIAGYQIVSIYINGILDKNYNYSELIANTGKLRIGVNSSTTNYFTGYIDEVRISNFTKTPAEIQRNMHTPILNLNKPVAPNITVAYNFDGCMHSGTRNGQILQNFGCRFSYATEISSPLFHLGAPHELTLDSFKIKHPFARIPASGTAGFTSDLLTIDKSITLNENKMKIFISLNHSYINNLKIELKSPQGDVVTLLNQINLTSNGFTCVINNETENMINGTFNDIAPIIGSASSFSIFNGKNSKGVWELKITDLANGNIGVLNSWGLFLDGVPYGISVNEFKNESNIAIFPNPSNGNFSIDMSNVHTKNNKLEIFNMLGERVYMSEITNTKSEIDISSYPKGIYFVKVNNNERMFTQKIIIQ